MSARFILYAIAGATALSASSCVRPPQLSPDVRRLRLGVDTLVISRTDSTSEQAVAVAIQSQFRTALEGRPTILQVYWHKDQISGAELVDSLWLNDPDLLPIRHIRHSAHSEVRLEYSGGWVRGSASVAGQPAQEVHDSLPEHTFDAASSDLVLRALGLGPLGRAQLNFYIVGVGVTTTTVRVAGEDTVITRSGASRPTLTLQFTFGDTPVLLRLSQDHADFLELIESPAGPTSWRYRR